METISGTAQKILVVDDDPGICEVLCEFLGEHGYAMRSAGNAVEMDRAIQADRPDLIVLDVRMPGENGLDVCRRLGRGGPAIIILSADRDDTARIIGLEIGADDYLGKPCNPRELLARIRAVLRRTDPAEEPVTTVYTFNGWRLSIDDRELLDPFGNPVALTGGEFALLKAFVENPQRILTRDQLAELIRGPSAETYDRAIDLQVSRLRRKLEDGPNQDMIQTIRGVGYRFTPKVRRT